MMSASDIMREYTEPSTARAVDTASPVFHALWIGNSLSPIAYACLASFVRVGHRVVLHSYELLRNVPPGVESADAGAIVPADRVFVHEPSQSYALFANYFRYKLLQRGLGIYIDCDLICVRQIDAGSPYVLGWQDEKLICPAILRLPPDAAALTALLRLFDMKVFTPPWYSWRERFTQYARLLLNRPHDVRHAPWGSAGPQAVTWYANKYGFSRHAAPPEVFFPVHWKDTARFMDPSCSWSALLTERTSCVHLWNEILRYRQIDVAEVPRASPLRQFVDGNWP